MTIPELLNSVKTIAVVGLSTDPDRPSFGVAKRLQQKGLTIIPVNPNLAEWEGLKSYPTVSGIPEQIRVDVVDVFRRSEATPDVVKDALLRNPRPLAVWLQSGVTSDESRRLSEEAGTFYVEDACLAVAARILPTVF